MGLRGGGLGPGRRIAGDRRRTALGPRGALAGAITVAAATALVASDRGRLVPVDVACVIPLLAWVLVPRFKRAGRHAPPMPAVLAAAICVALAWAARRVLI